MSQITCKRTTNVVILLILSAYLCIYIIQEISVHDTIQQYGLLASLDAFLRGVWGGVHTSFTNRLSIVLFVLATPVDKQLSMLHVVFLKV